MGATPPRATRARLRARGLRPCRTATRTSARASRCATATAIPAEERPDMNRLISFAIGLFILLAIGSSMVYVVDQRQYAVVFAFGEIKQVVREPGLHFKLPPPLQNVVFMDRRLQTIDAAANERFLTAEKKSMVVEWF